MKEAFDAIASRYDGQRRWIIPGFADFYGAAVRAAAWPGQSPRILDIGAGTGLLSALLLQKYPLSRLTLMDISPNMLDIARERFSGRQNVSYLIGDYSSRDLEGPYDLICSALSIHHLEHTQKQKLYRRVREGLSPGGIFVNADQVEGETPEEDRENIAIWDNFLMSGPLGDEERRSAVDRRNMLDRTEKLSVQLAWLREIGFSNVEVVYRYLSFVVMKGTVE